MKHIIVLVLLLSGCMSTPDSPIVPLADVDPTIGQDPRYASDNNFIGRPIRGYLAPQVMLTGEAAKALKDAQEMAQKKGYSFLVFDGYRPQQAVDHFVEWGADLADTLQKATYYPDVPKGELFDRGYIAARSGHSRGSTVDLTLTKDGDPLDMGTPFDFFDELSHTENPAITGEAMANRMLLKEIMESAGFSNYVNEWWHYTLKDEPYPDTYFDLPIE
ncbi:MAG: M15 family metallopeptidase [Bacteroidetes bacterium]|nr:M15 family metallopeptidase [Bacteroidota bacterium]MDA1333337.1 M15 family metallopeptidase [Bacteroidota bacterium]